MKKIVYPLFLLSLVVLFTSAISSFKNTTLVLPPGDDVLVLPDQTYDYSIDLPVHVVDFLLGWSGNDTSFVNTVTDDGATLGRVLFYDDRLSGDNSLSCGSCHQQALSFADNVPLSDGIGDNLTTRNSMNLNDLGWQLGFGFFWDFRSNGLEDAVLQPILAAHELGKNMPNLIAKLEAAAEYVPLFEAAYGNSEINEAKIANALAQFITSMTSFESKYDKQVSQGFTGFTASELSGMNLFELSCAFCHVTPHFGSTSPFDFFVMGNNGLDSVFTDLGMGEWFNEPSVFGFFKSPSLRNVAVSGPYMHDGRFETLEDVVDFYSEGIQSNENSSFNWMMGESFTGFEFSDQEKTDLVNFLKTLTDTNLLTNEKWSDPWVAVLGNNEFVLKGIKVYPNPVADLVVVEIDNPNDEIYNISIFDITGKLINFLQSSNDVLEIPRGNSPTGVYELVASKGQQQTTFKLVYR
ncbi:MAG: cytochrome c peroxidase [Saprospiraceae bacterium]|jgi:cytochrome c peroxidase